jgi:hypothetical protein
VAHILREQGYCAHALVGAAARVGGELIGG